MIRALESALREAWRQRGLVVPDAVQVLKLGHEAYPDPRAAFVFALFAAEPRPLAIAKVARSAEGDAGVQAEWQGVERVRALLGPDLAAAVPEPLAAGTVNGRRFGLWRALPGRTEWHHTFDVRGAGRATARIAAALAWIDAATRATTAGTLSGAEWLGDWDAIDHELHAGGCDPAVAGALRARLEPAWRSAWPAALAHGDFFPGNLLFEASRVSGVVDWGTLVPRAPLFVDPLTYEISFSLHTLASRGAVDVARAEDVHALAPFAAARAALARAGLDARWGGEVQLAAGLGGFLRELRAGRERVSGLWRGWLEHAIAREPGGALRGNPTLETARDK